MLKTRRAKRTFFSLILAVASAGVSISAMPPLSPAPFADKKQITDDFLYDTIRRKLASDQNVKGGALDLDVKEGVVTLKGTVENEKQKDKAEKLVKKVSGVKSVINQIKIANP